MLGGSGVRDLLERHGLAARRSLGQNFVVDPGVVRRIADLARVGPGDRVVEVGPGLGSLTLALLETGADVTVVEKDDDLGPAFDEVMARAGYAPTVLRADAVDLDWGATLVPPGDPWVLVANLPYNVAVPIVLGVLERAGMVQRLVVMVQREVADRLCATPGGRTIGVPTVKLGWWATARTVMSVPPEVFHPRPRVDSAVVEIVRHDAPPEHLRPTAFHLVEAAYGQRRKMLRGSLSSSVTPAQFAEAGVEPTARPETLGVADWARLAAAVVRRADGGSHDDGVP